MDKKTGRRFTGESKTFPAVQRKCLNVHVGLLSDENCEGNIQLQVELFNENSAYSVECFWGLPVIGHRGQITTAMSSRYVPKAAEEKQVGGK